MFSKSLIVPTMTNTITDIKLELLCKGVRLPEHLLGQFPGYIHKRASLSEGMCFDLWRRGHDRPLSINVAVHEKFVQESPFYYDDEHKLILKNNHPFINANLIAPPTWYNRVLDDGLSFNEIFQVHYKSILATCLTNFCEFKTTGRGCKFCAIGYQTEKNNIRQVRHIVSALKEIIGKEQNFTEININAGALINEKKAFDLYSDVITGIREVTDLPIYAQICPPLDLSGIDQLVEAGISTLSFNLEIFNEKLRRQIMPAKGCIPIEQYFKAIEYAIKFLGRGQVSSWLIAGLEPVDSTIEAAKQIASAGAIPFITVFRPLIGSKFENHPPPDPASIAPAFDALARILSEMKLDPAKSLCGCVKCNCCSALTENIF